MNAAIFGYGEAGGVAGENGVLGTGAVEGTEDLLLDRELLGDRLDDDVGGGQISQVGDALEPPEHLVGVVLTQLALGHPAVQKLLDPAEALVQKILVHFPDHNVHTRLGRDLGDSRSHQATPHHADCPDFHGSISFFSRTANGTPRVVEEDR